MAKLYWRVKVGGVWTYKPATWKNTSIFVDQTDIDCCEYLEEEE